MPHFFDRKHVYEKDWGTVTSAFWVKYPSEDAPHMKHVDTLCREVDHDAQLLRLRRLFVVEYPMPSWASRIFFKDLTALAVEEAECDLRTQRLTIRGSNLTWSKWFRVEETCTYEPHPENPEWTLYSMRSSYGVSGLGALCAQLEKAAVARAKETAGRGLELMTRKIDSVEAEWKLKKEAWAERLQRLKSPPSLWVEPFRQVQCECDANPRNGERDASVA